MGKVRIKTEEEIEMMHEGGKKLARIRNKLENKIKEGVTAAEIDSLAESLMRSMGVKPSFKMVPGYYWATCVNINEGVVHGIPKKELVFKNGDVVSIDLGIFMEGFHTDTSTSVLVGNGDRNKNNFLRVGKNALKSAIRQARIGKRIGDITSAIEDTIVKAGLSPIRSLVGHGIGRDLHESPFIPCFVSGTADESVVIEKGFVLAIEVMYVMGKPDLVIEKDGWTIRTKDGKIAGLFEETVAITNRGSLILTNDR